MDAVYSQVLGPSFETLAAPLKALHDGRTHKHFRGRCSVQAGETWLGKLIARLGGMPPTHADAPIIVTIERSGDREVWLRTFGAHRFRSIVRARDGVLEERLGLLNLCFELSAERERIEWRFARARWCGLPLPKSWFARCTAIEHVQEGRYCFDVCAAVQGVGLIVRYQGWLQEQHV